MRSLHGAWLILSLITAQAVLADSPIRAQVEVMVGPNVLVSVDDGGMPHSETMIAVNPRNDKNLLGTSIVFNGYHGTTCKTYASKDGGNTWTDSSFHERFRAGGTDPQIVFDPVGVAYFCSLSDGMQCHRSADGGTSWQELQRLKPCDHPQMVVDHTSGKFRGRVYISAMCGIRKLTVTRTEDGGRSFSSPVEVPNDKAIWRLNNNPLVLSDGTLFVPFAAWDDTGGKTATSGTSEFVTSSDGGVTFSAPSVVVEFPQARYVEPRVLNGAFVSATLPIYAVDLHRRIDRLYVAWSDHRLGKQRVFIAYSSDKGKTWSAPRVVAADAPSTSSQFQAMLAVNNEGTVGVAWFDTRNSATEESYDLYFAASIDGGETFLQPTRVSTQSSPPATSANLTPFSGYRKADGASITQVFRTNFGRWGNGGDYMGFVADHAGDFHPFWVDSRTGSAQLWTSHIRVAHYDEAVRPTALSRARLDGRLALVLDPPVYDMGRQEAAVPIRLRNISSDAIYGPICVSVDEVKNWTLLNDSRQTDKANCSFDYSKALGDIGSLPPDAVTEAVLWKFKFSGLASSPSIKVHITGSLSK